MAEPAPATIRLDKWLLYARLCKSRTLAQALVEAGGVRVNRILATKPGHALHQGDVLTVARGGQVLVLRLLGIPLRRGPATEARLAYEEIPPAA